MASIVDATRYSDLCRLCAIKTALGGGIHIFENEGTLRELNKKIETCLPVQVSPWSILFLSLNYLLWLCVMVFNVLTST